MKFQILETDPADAQHNMDRDSELLNQLQENPQPLLHFYEWKFPSITHGYFIQPDQFFHLDILKERQIQLGRRPTGGGITFHFCDLAFSVLIPASHPNFSLNTLENYAFINQKVLKAIGQFLRDPIGLSLAKEGICCRQNPSFCMAAATKYDILSNGRKVGGAAQRRTKHGFLHQGSIFLGIPPIDDIQSLLKPENQLLENMWQNSHALLGNSWTAPQLLEAKQTLRILLSRFFCEI